MLNYAYMILRYVSSFDKVTVVVFPMFDCLLPHLRMKFWRGLIRHILASPMWNQVSRHDNVDVEPQVRCGVQHTRGGQSFVAPSVRTTSSRYNHLEKVEAALRCANPCRSVCT